MRTYFSPWQTSTANVTKPFLPKPAHPVRLNIGTLQNLTSCFHTSWCITSIHCQLPLQKHVNNNINGVSFVTRKHMSPQGPIFAIWFLVVGVHCVRFFVVLCFVGWIYSWNDILLYPTIVVDWEMCFSLLSMCSRKYLFRHWKFDRIIGYCCNANSRCRVVVVVL